MTTTPMTWLQVTFPSDLDKDHVLRLLETVHGLSGPGRRRPFVFEIAADERGVRHHLALHAALAPTVVAWATANVPGLHLAEVDRPQLEGLKAARRIWLSTSRRPLGSLHPEAVSSALLSAVHTHGRGELVVLQWVFGPVRRSSVIPVNHPALLSERWLSALTTAAITGPTELDAEARMAMRDKQGQTGGWRATGRIGVRAATPSKAHFLLGNVIGAMRTAEGPGVQLGYQNTPVPAVAQRKLPWTWPLALSVDELVGLIAWPISDLHGIPVNRRRAKLMPGRTAHDSAGRTLAIQPNTGDPIMVAAKDIGLHCLITGPTGCGKSTAISRMVVDDMNAGRSVFVMEPKEDLVESILARIPENRLADVVVLDASARCIGFNPLAGDSPELVADQILSVIAKLNSDNWGPRLAEILHAGILTLACSPGMSLSALPLLLTNDGFRRRLVGKINDPLGISPIWAGFERLSDDARAQATASILNKIRPLVGRAQMRGILGQAEPKFSMSDLFTGRKIVLVDLAKGVIGPDSARLLGTLILNHLWNICLTRTSIPEARRHTVAVYIDELQDYVGIPADLGEMLAQARGLGVGFTLACQHAGQLPPDLLQGALTNCRSKMIFQTESSDGNLFSKGQTVLSAEDFSNLPAREVYIKVAANAEVTPWMSGRTQPATPTTSDPKAVRATSLERYGVSRADTDTALRALVEPPRPSTAPTVGSRRRQA